MNTAQLDNKFLRAAKSVCFKRAIPVVLHRKHKDRTRHFIDKNEISLDDKNNVSGFSLSERFKKFKKSIISWRSPL
jgi:hypothetical protein